MKRVFYGFLFFMLLLFEAAFISVGVDYWRDGRDWKGTLFCILAAIASASVEYE